MLLEIFDKEELVVVTHSGNFHPDDIFAVATLMLVFEDKYKIKIIRTREQAEIDKADFVVDVGMIYDKQKNRFDHHQYGGAGQRDNGIPYASFGLVWDKYGEYLCGSKEVSTKVDSTIASPIDARDNGINLQKIDNEWGIVDYSFFNISWVFRSTWKESKELLYENFIYLVELAKNIIKRTIIFVKDNLEGDIKIKDIYNNSNDKRLLIIDKEYKFEEFVSINKDIFLVIYPKVFDNTWAIESARDSIMSFSNRVSFPDHWLGKRGQELEKETGIVGSLFCHKVGFLCVTKTKEQAIEIAKKVIPNLKI